MLQNTIRSDAKIERKIISVSVKRQLTIPQKYFEALGFSDEAECIMLEDGLLIRPVRVAGGSEFSEQIFADLISQGYEGQELLKKFKEYSKAVRPAVKKMLKENEAFARSGEGRMSISDLFGTEA